MAEALLASIEAHPGAAVGLATATGAALTALFRWIGAMLIGNNRTTESVVKMMADAVNSRLSAPPNGHGDGGGPLHRIEAKLDEYRREQVAYQEATDCRLEGVEATVSEAIKRVRVLESR